MARLARAPQRYADLRWAAPQGRPGTDRLANLIDYLAPDEPLLRLDNVTLTSHAGYNTPEAAMTMYRRAIDLAAAG